MATSPTSPTGANFTSVGTRRKPQNALPSLPASAFSAPTPPPAAHDPTVVIDAFYAGTGVKGPDIDVSFEKFDLNHTPEPASGQKKHLFAAFAGKEASEGAYAASLKWARESASTVDITIVGDITEDAHLWESLETLLSQSSGGAPIVLSNVLPPPQTQTTSTVATLALASSPSYLSFQSNIAALSLFSSVSVKILPPKWGEEVPESGEAKEDWKRRVTMYLGPVLEAFGQERILFGSGSTSTSGAWYSIVRESFAELAVEQEVLDDVFGGNAKKVYGKLA